MNKSNLTLPYWDYPKLDLGSLENDECVSEFRFEKKDVYILGEKLEIPECTICYSGTKVDGIESLCIYLKRFAYPCRYLDYAGFRRTLSCLYARWGHLLKTMIQQWLAPVNLQLALIQFMQENHR